MINKVVSLEEAFMKEHYLHTKLCDLFGIEYPIILAGMGRTSGPALVAAVSNAGGLGVIGATYLQPEQLRDWIKKTRQLTDKPFGVDLLVPRLAAADTYEEIKAQLPREHVEYVEKLKKELEVPEPKGTAHRWMMSQELVQGQLRVILEERPAVFTAGLGLPSEIVPELHERGIKIISLVGNVRNARRVAETGADVIVAQGHESGGHTGRIGTLALVPQVVDAVSPIPVVAAGGIADGRGLAAALSLGAVGALVGTAFLACEEASVDHISLGIMSQAYVDHWKQDILSATEEDASITRVYTGKTARHIKDKLIERWEEKDKFPTLPMPLQRILISDLIAGISQAGKFEYLSGMAGQIAGMLKESKSANQVVEEMVSQAAVIIKDLKT